MHPSQPPSSNTPQPSHNTATSIQQRTRRDYSIRQDIRFHPYTPAWLLPRPDNYAVAESSDPFPPALNPSGSAASGSLVPPPLNPVGPLHTSPLTTPPNASTPPLAPTYTEDAEEGGPVIEDPFIRDYDVSSIEDLVEATYYRPGRNGTKEHYTPATLSTANLPLPISNRAYYPHSYHQLAFDQMERGYPHLITAREEIGLNRLLSGSPEVRNGRPPHHMLNIVKCAILGSPRHRLTLDEICTALCRRFVFFANVLPRDSWEGTLKHTLTHHGETFRRVKIGYLDRWWVVARGAHPDFTPNARVPRREGGRYWAHKMKQKTQPKKPGNNPWNNGSDMFYISPFGLLPSVGSSSSMATPRSSSTAASSSMRPPYTRASGPVSTDDTTYDPPSSSSYCPSLSSAPSSSAATAASPSSSRWPRALLPPPLHDGTYGPASSSSCPPSSASVTSSSYRPSTSAISSSAATTASSSARSQYRRSPLPMIADRTHGPVTYPFPHRSSSSSATSLSPASAPRCPPRHRRLFPRLSSNPPHPHRAGRPGLHGRAEKGAASTAGHRRGMSPPAHAPLPQSRLPPIFTLWLNEPLGRMPPERCDLPPLTFPKATGTRPAAAPQPVDPLTDPWTVWTPGPSLLDSSLTLRGHAQDRLPSLHSNIYIASSPEHQPDTRTASAEGEEMPETTEAKGKGRATKSDYERWAKEDRRDHL